jgi:hypothetical protein
MPPPVVAINPDAEWINGREASREIGCSPTALQRAALLGQVRIKLDPGIPPQYNRADCKRIAQARASHAAGELQAAGA